jgi:hypothetical protein
MGMGMAVPEPNQLFDRLAFFTLCGFELGSRFDFAVRTEPFEAEERAAPAFDDLGHAHMH